MASSRYPLQIECADAGAHLVKIALRCTVCSMKPFRQSQTTKNSNKTPSSDHAAINIKIYYVLV